MKMIKNLFTYWHKLTRTELVDDLEREFLLDFARKLHDTTHKPNALMGLGPTDPHKVCEAGESLHCVATIPVGAEVLAISSVKEDAPHWLVRSFEVQPEKSTGQHSPLQLITGTTPVSLSRFSSADVAPFLFNRQARSDLKVTAEVTCLTSGKLFHGFVFDLYQEENVCANTFYTEVAERHALSMYFYYKMLKRAANNPNCE